MGTEGVWKVKLCCVDMGPLPSMKPGQDSVEAKLNSSSSDNANTAGFNFSLLDEGPLKQIVFAVECIDKDGNPVDGTVARVKLRVEYPQNKEMWKNYICFLSGKDTQFPILVDRLSFSSNNKKTPRTDLPPPGNQLVGPIV